MFTSLKRALRDNPSVLILGAVCVAVALLTGVLSAQFMSIVPSAF